MYESDIFQNKTALVTGGARGIGRAVCLMLAQYGARVAVNYRENREAADETVHRIEKSGGEGIAIRADVSAEKDVEEMVVAVRSQWGPIDLLVNNAGVVETVAHGTVTFEGWKRMFAVNADGPFLTTWAVKDDMIARGYGRIVNVSSLAGVVPKDNQIHYGSAKAALIAFTRHCARAFAPHNIRVNCVAPGLTNTALAQQADPGLVADIVAITPMGRMGEPEEIASTVKYLLSDDSSFVTGQTINACGGRT
ncbi:MAG: SDR family oxidoreductase [Candidatus Latescibacteria bacterium]|nr:SDR family oxidoreductase [Candidatus Latescibacterota bacterium]